MLKVLTRLSPQTAWTSDWLHANVKDKFKGKMGLGKYVLEHYEKPQGDRKEHRWKISTENTNEKARLDQAVKKQQPGLVIASEPIPKAEGNFNWNGLNLRSIAEQKIAEELEKRHILFFVNARCRISDRRNIVETKEADFIIFYKKQARILEVDGREYHQSAATDHQRDRLFERHGIRCTRFTANECLNDPQNVVDEFLELFEGEPSLFQTNEHSNKKYPQANEKAVEVANEKTIEVVPTVTEVSKDFSALVSRRQVRIARNNDDLSDIEF